MVEIKNKLRSKISDSNDMRKRLIELLRPRIEQYTTFLKTGRQNDCNARKTKVGL